MQTVSSLEPPCPVSPGTWHLSSCFPKWKELTPEFEHLWLSVITDCFSLFVIFLSIHLYVKVLKGVGVGGSDLLLLWIVIVSPTW